MSSIKFLLALLFIHAALTFKYIHLQFPHHDFRKYICNIQFRSLYAYSFSMHIYWAATRKHYLVTISIAIQYVCMFHVSWCELYHEC